MRFLVDNAVSPTVAEALSRAGHDAMHVRDVAMSSAPDAAIFDLAARTGRIIISADTDFGTLLATRRAAEPSLILFRHGAEHDPHRQSELLLANLSQVADALEDGALVTLEPNRIRVRKLPLWPSDAEPRTP